MVRNARRIEPKPLTLYGRKMWARRKSWRLIRQNLTIIQIILEKYENTVRNWPKRVRCDCRHEYYAEKTHLFEYKNILLKSYKNDVLYPVSMFIARY